MSVYADNAATPQTSRAAIDAMHKYTVWSVGNAVFKNQSQKHVTARQV